MEFVTLLSCALLAQLVLLILKILVVARWLDGEQGRWVELAGSAALVVGVHWFARQGGHEAGAGLAAASFGVVQLALSHLAPMAAALLADLGEDDEPLPLDYAWAVATLAGVSAFALANRDGLLDGLVVHYMLYLVASALAAALVAALEEADPDAPVATAVHLVLATALAGGLYLTAAATTTPGRAWLVSLISCALAAVIQLQVLLIAIRCSSSAEFDSSLFYRSLLGAGCAAGAISVLWAWRLLA
jgi:hypothetical protein